MSKHKVLVITASPRNGNSTHAARQFIRRIKGRKTMIDINRLDIRPCGACHKCAEKLKCIYNDDASRLIKLVENSDAVIVASPVYFTGVPGPLKTFIDRNQEVWERWRKNGPGSRVQGPGKDKPGPQNLSSEPKTGVIILSAGHKNPEHFKPAESEIRSFFAVNKIKTRLVMKMGNMDEKGEIRKYRKKITASAKEFSKKWPA